MGRAGKMRRRSRSSGDKSNKSDISADDGRIVISISKSKDAKMWEFWKELLDDVRRDHKFKDLVAGLVFLGFAARRTTGSGWRFEQVGCAFVTHDLHGGRVPAKMVYPWWTRRIVDRLDIRLED